MGAAGDAAEHEAERTADHVTSGPANSKPTISRLETLQRQVAEIRRQAPAEPNETPSPAMQRAHATPAVQREAKMEEAAKPSAQRDAKKDGSPAPAVQRAEPETKNDAHATPAVQREAKMEEAAKPSAQRDAKKEDSPSPAIQRADSESKDAHTTAAVQRDAKKDEATPPAVQRAEDDVQDKPAEPDVQRCGCVEEKMQHRPSGTASVQCKSAEPEMPGPTVHRKSADVSPTSHMDDAAARAISTKDSGSPMREPVRRTLESRMGVDLTGVRVHEGPAAQDAATALNARAFTHKNDIWLGRGESQDNVHLMAHETTHVVQQGAAVRRAPEKIHPDEDEQHTVQRSLLGDIAGAAGAAWDATGGKLVDAAGNAIAMGADFFWKLVTKVLPQGIVDLIQNIRSKGIVGYLREKVSGAFNSVFGGLSADGGFIAGLIKTFSKLVNSAGNIVTALGHGDCQPLFDAVSQLGEMLGEMAGEAWDKIKEFFAPIGDFFSDLWQKFGAPAVDFLVQYASDTWDGIKALGKLLWDSTEPVRSALSAAWSWLKDQLGIGDEPDGQNGLLQWVQGKLSEAWDWIKDKLKPVIGPIQSMVAKIKEIIPLDKILNLRQTVHEWLQHAKEMVTHMRKPQGVTEDQEVLRDKILPAIKAAIVNLGIKIAGAGSWVASQIGGIAQSVTAFFSSLRSNSVLGALAGAIQWVQDKVNSLSEWVQGGVVGLFNSMGKGVAKLADFVEPVLNILKKIVSVVVNVVKELPGLVMGPLWKAIPACIRNPIKDFIIKNILSQIPVISTFVKIPDIWDKIQKLVMNFLSAVFVNGDLSGAAFMVIRFVLETAGINVDLMLSVLGKAAGALDDIIMHPVEFLKNLLAAVKKGFDQFLDNILTHLMHGLIEWILGPLADLGVKPPKDFSLPSLLELALEILGITSAKLREKLEKAIGPTATAILTEAWNWISALITGGFSGLWEQIKSRLSDLYDSVIGGITQWITVSVVKAGIQQLALLSNPVGAVLEAIKTIYTTINFLVTKMNKILGVVDAVLDSINKIISGDIAAAATWVEGAMARLVAPVISFFADWVGIDSPGESLKGIVEGIQGKVDEALDWLIDKAVGIAKSLLGALGIGEKPDDRTPEQKQADLNAAMSEASTAASEPNATSATVEAKLPAIKKTYRMKVLELRPMSGKEYDIHGEINPTADVVKPLESAVPKPEDIESLEPAYGSIDSSRGGTSMVAERLTPKLKEGSVPSSSPGVWDKVGGDALKRGGKKLYVRGHLLNRRLGGPGDTRNLTPITYSANGSHFQQVESDIISMVKSDKTIVKYEVDVLPPAASAPEPGVLPEEQQLSAGLEFKWWEQKVKGGTAAAPELATEGRTGSGFVPNVPPFPNVGEPTTVQTAPLDGKREESRTQNCCGTTGAWVFPMSAKPDPVVQRQPVDPPQKDPYTAEIEEEWQDQYDEWTKQSEDDSNPLQAAYAHRVLLLMDLTNADQFYLKEDFDKAMAAIQKTAYNEEATLAQLTPHFAAEQMTAYFPRHWADKVRHVMYTVERPVDIASYANSEWAYMDKTGDTISDLLFDHGLEVGFLDSLDLQSYYMPPDAATVTGITREWTLRFPHYSVLMGKAAFAEQWLSLARMIATSIENGTSVVLYDQYLKYVEVRPNGFSVYNPPGLLTAVDLASLSGEIDLSKADSTISFLSMLIGVPNGIKANIEAGEMARLVLRRADRRIYDLGSIMTLAHGTKWIFEKNFVGSAMSLIAQALKENWKDMLWDAGKQGAIYLAAQATPVTAFIADVKLLHDAIEDALDALSKLWDLEEAVRKANTVVDLQRASAQLALGSLENGIKLMMSIEQVKGSLGMLKGLSAKVGGGADQAAEEATKKIAAEARNRTAKDVRDAAEDLRKQAEQDAEKAAKKAAKGEPGEHKPGGEKPDEKLKPGDKIPSLPGCRAGSIYCPLDYMRHEFRDLFAERMNLEAAQYMRGEPSLELTLGRSLRRTQTILTGDAMYRQFLREVPEGEWNELFREAVERRGREGVDFRILNVDGQPYRWPLDGSGRPWPVHHDPPLFMVGAEDTRLWDPMPQMAHETADKWWRKLYNRILEKVPEDMRQDVLNDEGLIDLRDL